MELAARWDAEMIRMNRGGVVPWAVALAGLAIAAVIACDSPDSISHEGGWLAGAAMADGGTVGDLLLPETASVVLVYPPSECFSCTGLLPQWIELGHQRNVPVSLVLTRQPTQAEANTLKLVRVIPAGVLKSEPSDTSTSSAYIFDGMAELASAIGIGNQSALLGELTTPASTEDNSNPYLPSTHRR